MSPVKKKLLWPLLKRQGRLYSGYCNRETMNSTPNANRDNWGFTTSSQSEGEDRKLPRGTWLSIKCWGKGAWLDIKCGGTLNKLLKHGSLLDLGLVCQGWFLHWDEGSEKLVYSLVKEGVLALLPTRRESLAWDTGWLKGGRREFLRSALGEATLVSLSLPGI